MLDVVSKRWVGQRKGLLIVVSADRCEETWVDCICDCGGTRRIRASVFRREKSLSCGCTKRASELVNSPTYHTWSGMKQRCLNEKHGAFENYGGRGIAVCESWLSFEGFLKDMGIKPVGKELDRIDNDGNYEPDNCRWTTRLENIRNRRATRWLTHRGKTQTLSEWARELGIPRERVSRRLARGWSVNDALTKDKV